MLILAIVASLFHLFAAQGQGGGDRPPRPPLGYAPASSSRQPAQDTSARLSAIENGMSAIENGMSAIENELRDLQRISSWALPQDCSTAQQRAVLGPYQMISVPFLPPKIVRCDMKTLGGGWTVALWREPMTAEEVADPEQPPKPLGKLSNDGNINHLDHDFPGEHRRYRQHARLTAPQPPFLREDFNRTWEEYKQGFGGVRGEHWIGNRILHALTSLPLTQWEALILLKDWRGNQATASYKNFSVGSEADQFRLTASGFDHATELGDTAGDGLAFHDQSAFSTYDRDNDQYHGSHCGQQFGAGWWFRQCHVALLTGSASHRTGSHAVHWRKWRGEHALRSAAILIRPRR